MKKHIETKYNKNFNHKKIRRYKVILGLLTIKPTKKGLPFHRTKEKNPVSKALYLIEYNFKSDKLKKKLSSDVSYIKCTDGTLYLSAIQYRLKYFYLVGT